MHINTEQLPQRLQRGLSPLYVLYGDETLLALEAADRIRFEARRQGYAEREVVTADSGFNWAELAMRGNSLSLFSDKKILELRIPSGKPGVDGAEALRRYCDKLPQDTVTVISFPAVDRQAQNSKWFEVLAQAGIVISANRVERHHLPQWIGGRLKSQNQDADPQALEFIADCVEGNLLAAHHEVQKLGLLFPPGELAFEDVKAAVLDVARYDPFQIGETLLRGNANRLVKILAGLQGEGIAPSLILWVYTEQINVLLKLFYGLKAGKPEAQLLRDSRVPRSRHNLVTSALKRFRVAQMQQALCHAAAIDKTIKGLLGGNVWDELTRLGLRFCGDARLPRPTLAQTG